MCSLFSRSQNVKCHNLSLSLATLCTESTKFEWKNKKKAMELHIFLIENLFDEDLVLPTQQ